MRHVSNVSISKPAPAVLHSLMMGSVMSVNEYDVYLKRSVFFGRYIQAIADELVLAHVNPGKVSASNSEEVLACQGHAEKSGGIADIVSST